MTLLMPREVDRILRYPRGRALRLAKAGKLPHILLPDGEIRFDRDELERAIRAGGTDKNGMELPRVEFAGTA
jgi:hypothetical protein